jgi:hypothetical protein
MTKPRGNLAENLSPAAAVGGLDALSALGGFGESMAQIDCARLEFNGKDRCVQRLISAWLKRGLLAETFGHLEGPV